MNEEKARERIQELKDYRSHLVSFVAVNIFLFAINVMTSPGSWWFVFPLFGWGIGLAIHTFDTFWGGSDWEDRKLEELTGLKQTRDEMQQLSERTENLVKILSSVDWEKIDPALLETRNNLEEARRKVESLTSQSDPKSQAEVTREIEKLEEFVTSSRFDYYDLASKQATQGSEKPPAA